MSRLEMVFFHFLVHNAHSISMLVIFARNRYSNQINMIQELKREIAVHDNASVADKLLSCLDSNYCLTLLNPCGPSTIHVDSDSEGRGIQQKQFDFLSTK